MTSEHQITFAPRTIAQARTTRAQKAWRSIWIVALRIARRLRAIRDRMRLARQYRRELAFLAQGNDRILSDIGLTRYDVVAAARENDRWFGRGQALHMAAIRREEAAALSRTRRKTLTVTESPSLVPDTPRVVERPIATGRPRR